MNANQRKKIEERKKIKVELIPKVPKKILNMVERKKIGDFIVSGDKKALIIRGMDGKAKIITNGMLQEEGVKEGIKEVMHAEVMLKHNRGKLSEKDLKQLLLRIAEK